MKKQRGFTLIEALITLAVLGVGLAGSAKLQSLVLSHMLNAKAQHEALQFTLQEIEKFRYAVRYSATPPTLPIHETRQGIHSHYRLQGIDTSTGSTILRKLEFNTYWQTPGTNGVLTVSTLSSGQSYTQHLHRLKDN